jgi:hypothetical protein
MASMLLPARSRGGVRLLELLEEGRRLEVLAESCGFG